MQNNLPQKMRAKQVAKEFSIGVSTLWKYVKDGKIKAYRVTDGVTVFDKEEIIIFFGGKSQNVEVVA
jgi:predicted site-specific integrase-resolvase